MIEPTCSRRDAASVIFNLPDYHVIDAIDLPSGGRRVIVQADTVADGCPDCGVVSERVHAWSRQRVKDIPQAGGIELVVVKPRWCAPSERARAGRSPKPRQSCRCGLGARAGYGKPC